MKIKGNSRKLYEIIKNNNNHYYSKCDFLLFFIRIYFRNCLPRCIPKPVLLLLVVVILNPASWDRWSVTCTLVTSCKSRRDRKRHNMLVVLLLTASNQT